MRILWGKLIRGLRDLQPLCLICNFLKRIPDFPPALNMFKLLSAANKACCLRSTKSRKGVCLGIASILPYQYSLHMHIEDLIGLKMALLLNFLWTLCLLPILPLFVQQVLGICIPCVQSATSSSITIHDFHPF